MVATTILAGLFGFVLNKTGGWAADWAKDSVLAVTLETKLLKATNAWKNELPTGLRAHDLNFDVFWDEPAIDRSAVAELKLAERLWGHEVPTTDEFFDVLFGRYNRVRSGYSEKPEIHPPWFFRVEVVEVEPELERLAEAMHNVCACFPELRDPTLIKEIRGIAARLPAVVPRGEALPDETERHGIDLDAYLKTLLAEVDHIDIKGISTSVRAAMREPIENLYTPLHSHEDNFVGDAEQVLLTRGEEQDTEVFLPELLGRHRHLLLVGKPGSGKTTFIHLVACMLARDLREPRPPDAVPWREEHLGMARDKPPPIPALIRLRELVHDLLGRDPKAMLPSDQGWLLRRLGERTQPAGAVSDHGLEARQQQWARWLAGDEAILLLDGLDEVADLVLRDRVLAIVRSACEIWPKCQVIVTSRPILVEAMTAAPLCFHQAEIAEFDQDEVLRFVEQWSKALYHRQESLSAENTRSLLAALRDRPELLKLARNPVMLTCLCVIHYNERGELPSGQARVFRAIFNWMLRSRRAQRRYVYAAEVSCDQARSEREVDSLAENALYRLALAMMEGTERRPGKIASIDVGDAATAIEGEILRYFPDDREAPRERAERWLRGECELSALIEEVAGNQLKFWHLTIQEFLAAWAISRRTNWWQDFEGHLDDPQWDNVVELFSGCVFEAGGRDRVDELIEKLLDRGMGKGLLVEAQTLVLVDRVLESMSAYEYREDRALVRRQEALVDQVMAIFSVAGAAKVPLETRIAAAEVVGRWGDPRFAEEVDNFVEIPGTGLRLGRYPVTVVEFGRFVAAGGYEVQEWWAGVDLEWRKERSRPWEWEFQQQHPSRPIVVTWPEAQAYCRWLSVQLGMLARLPSAKEWERAATPLAGPYPWGVLPTCDEDEAESVGALIANSLANYGVSLGPTPVGLYPAGAGPSGHVDLAGNLWEWCKDGPSDREDMRYVKGNCWAGGPTDQLEVPSYGLAPVDVFMSDVTGFRVVVASEPG